MPNERKVIEIDFKKREKVREIISEPQQGEFSDKLIYFSSLIADRKVETWFASHPEVEMPDNLRVNQVCIFSWSHKFGLPDFEYDDEGVRGTLSVAGVNHFISIPWKYVARIRDAADHSVQMDWSVVVSKATSVMKSDLRTKVRKSLLRGLKKLFKK